MSDLGNAVDSYARSQGLIEDGSHLTAFVVVGSAENPAAGDDGEDDLFFCHPGTNGREALGLLLEGLKVKLSE